MIGNRDSKYRSTLLCFLSIGLSLVLTSAVRAGEVVVPSALESVEGEFNNGFPFNISLFAQYGINSIRYQQVFSHEEFSGSPVEITEIRFRPDIQFGTAFDATLSNVQINLSTTASPANALSTVFAENVGSDDTIVHSGSLHLSSSATGAGPRDFDIIISLQTPFTYDPSQGNLLLDVRNFDGPSSATTQLDATNQFPDSTGRSFLAGDVNGTSGYADSYGLVTKFVYQESAPSALAVEIDVKPGNADNKINLKTSLTSASSKSKKNAQTFESNGNGNPGGVIPVAILTTTDYDALLTDDSSIAIGDPVLGGTSGALRSSAVDVDDDGDLDLLFHFSIADLVAAGALDGNSEFLFLTGQTLDGTPISGLDIVSVSVK